MLQTLKSRTLAGIAGAAAVFWMVAGSAMAQNKEPIRIGFSMALTGPLASNGKQALLGMKIWEEETNAKGGLIGRPVKLVYYDDQSNPSTVPGIYTKLLDVDKVDLVIGPYATAMIAPAMPVVIEIRRPPPVFAPSQAISRPCWSNIRPLLRPLGCRNTAVLPVSGS